MVDDRTTGNELLEQVAVLKLKVRKSKVSPCGDNVRVCIEMEEDPAILAGSCFGLIFALAVLSFHGARPRGVSSVGGYDEDDTWTVGDMLKHLRFDHGRIEFYADYVRGRMMKTEVTVSSNGSIELETKGRGEAASRWVALLQGKKVLHAVPSLAPDAAES